MNLNLIINRFLLVQSNKSKPALCNFFFKGLRENFKPLSKLKIKDPKFFLQIHDVIIKKV